MRHTMPPTSLVACRNTTSGCHLANGCRGGGGTGPPHGWAAGTLPTFPGTLAAQAIPAALAGWRRLRMGPAARATHKPAPKGAGPATGK